MPDKQDESVDAFYNRLTKTPPRLTIVSDQSLSDEDFRKDSFQLAPRLGPVYDILRHINTKTPMSVAIYGDWGSGKTSAMKWLHGLLSESNNHNSHDRVRIRPVWFYPWKYHTKEDVWRGLISEVIINSIDLTKADSAARVINAAKQFGMFLGRSFIHAMAGLTLKVQDPTQQLGVDIKLEGIKDILDDYRVTSHPETAYLNEFEHSLEDWVTNTLGSGERMVIFIDDLDRCMPDIALQVLEALKLYLNIVNLVFVVGVDRAVIQDLVKGYYCNLKLDEWKSRQYLAKMFQVEVEVAPHEQQMGDYLDEQLLSIDYWQELQEAERQVLRSVVLRLAGRNPREVKRLVNSALMAGGGTVIVSDAVNSDNRLQEFMEGVNVFLLRQILERRYPKDAKLIGTRNGDSFFSRWSNVVRSTANFSTSHSAIHIPRHIVEQETDLGVLRFADIEERDVIVQEIITENTVAYQPVIEQAIALGILHLMVDLDVCDLVRFGFPDNTASVLTALGADPESSDLSADVFLKLVNRFSLVTPADFEAVTTMNLSGESISNLDYIVSRFPGIIRLDLRQTQVADLTPLMRLRNLTELNVSSTRVSDLTSLTKLSKLRSLSAGSTKVSSLVPLAKLHELNSLYMGRTEVKDISPLRYLTQLQGLNLRGTPIVDISPVGELQNLIYLSIRDTAVTSLEPLKALSKLKRLDIRGTNVTDLAPLMGLVNLADLYIDEKLILGEQGGLLCSALSNLHVIIRED